MKRLLIPLLTLTILGAGCAPTPAEPSPSPSVPTPSKPGTTSPTPEPTPTPSEPSDSSETRALTPATTDASWNTYTSTALGFSFMWPTKGRYAPEWEVKIFKETDPTIKEGCYVSLQTPNADTRMVSVGTQSFCNTSGNEGAAGSVYFTDAYTTKIGSSFAVLLFTKKVTNGGIIPNCSETYSSVSTACVPFLETEYQAALDGIVGTFQLTE